MEYCPVCSSRLPEGEPDSCPECEADLTPFYEVSEKSEEKLEAARACLKRGDTREARELADEAVKLWGGNASPAREVKLESLLTDHELDTAREVLESDGLPDNTKRDFELRLQKLEEEEQAAKEHFNAGLVSARKGFYRDAERELEEAIEIAPQLVRPYAALAKVYLELDRPEDALEVIDRAHQRAPADREIDLLRLEIARRREPPERREPGDSLYDELFPEGFWVWLVDNAVEILVLILLVWLLMQINGLQEAIQGLQATGG